MIRVLRSESASQYLRTTRQAIDPQAAIGMSITRRFVGIFQIGGDRRPKRGAQHGRAAAGEASIGGQIVVLEPARFAHSEANVSAGLIRKRRKWVLAKTVLKSWGSEIERQV